MTVCPPQTTTMSLDDDSYDQSQSQSQPDSQYSQWDSNPPSQTDSSNNSTQTPNQLKDPLTDLIPVRNYLSLRDYEHFKWDEEGAETSEKWLKPVRDAGLDPQKHKVFHHGNKDYIIPGTHPFDMIGYLGQSGSNTIYKATSPPAQNYKRPLALKVIVCTDKTRTPGPRSRARRQALQEVRNMTKIRHSHIVVYVASFEDYCIYITKRKTIKNGVKVSVTEEEIQRHILGIAMYPPAKYNLRDLMENRRGHRREMRCMHSYFGCLAQAVAYLHKSDVQIRHKDIKPANIVIDENNIPLLTDFGLSNHFEVGKDSDGPTAKTMKYAEPEAVHERGRNARSDIFPLGCVFLEMATTLLSMSPRFAEQRLKTVGSREEFRYSGSLDRLPSYLTELEDIAQDLIQSDPGRERSARAIIQILPIIKDMMDEDIKARPYAKQLFPKFRHLYDVYPKDSGPCKSCEEEIATERSFPLLPSPSMLAGRTLTRSSTGASGVTHATGSSSRTGTTHTASSAGGVSGGSNRSSLVVGVMRRNSMAVGNMGQGGMTGSPTELTGGG